MMNLAAVPDAELLAQASSLRGRERELTAQVVAHLVEIERRGLHLAEGFSSLFAYCRERLGYSEHECYARIEAARCAREVPGVLEALRQGAVTMTAVALLRPHLNAENKERLLAEASGRTKREVEEIVVKLRPQPETPATVRKLPAPIARGARPFPLPGHHRLRDQGPPPARQGALIGS